MYPKSVKKLSLMMLVGLLTSLLIVPLSYAEGIKLDGVIDEPEYNLWIKDNDQPKFSVYYATDEANVYVGIVFNDSVSTNDLAVFAFKAETHDWFLQITGGNDISFRPSGGGYYGWWQHKREGLPSNVSLVTGTTNGYTSLEISIPKSMLGSYGEDFPLNAEIWIKYQTENGGPVNYYPQNLADWFFVVNEKTFTMQEEEPPQFHAPEVPYGTIVALSVMAAALVVYNRKSKNLT